MPPKLKILAVISLVAIGAIVWALAPESPERLRARAEAATRAEDWPTARALWSRVNQTRLATERTYLAEAKACLALDRADDAEMALRRAIADDPSDPEPWRALLQVCRVEDRPLEALELGWAAYDAVAPAGRRDVLRDLTLALLADLPDDIARRTLEHWVAADPNDINARVALLQRISAMPMAGDPDRDSGIETLTAMLARRPDHTPAREALAITLADAGEIERGRRILDDWPADARDARFWRLRGRWDLDYDHQPEAAIAAFERTLADLPHDWRTDYRLARALKAAGRKPEAARAAESVRRLREILDPAALGPRLSQDLTKLDDPRALLDLADLCTRTGLTRLADAWRREAALAASHEPMTHGR